MMIIKFNSLKPVKHILYIVLLFCASCKEQKPPQVTFDIPALIGKNIDEVRKVLGKPVNKILDPVNNNKVKNYVNIFHKDDQKLLVSFDPNSRKINFFYIITSIDYDNVKDIMKVGNLDSVQTMNYFVEPEHTLFTNSFDGIKIILR